MKKFIALISILLLLGASGCLLERTDVEETTDEEVVEEVTEEETVEEATEEEVVEITEEDMAEGDAEFAESVDVFSEIINDENSDSSDCENIADDDLRKSCEQRFIYENAVESGKTNDCYDLDNEVDQEMCVEEIEEMEE